MYRLINYRNKSLSLNEKRLPSELYEPSISILLFRTNRRKELARRYESTKRDLEYFESEQKSITCAISIEVIPIMDFC